MTGDDYLNSIITKYSVNVTGAQRAGQTIYPVIERWSNSYLIKAEFSGSLSKGTAISLGTDADIFISMSSNTPGTLSDLYNTLYNAISQAGYAARKQNVSIGTTVNGYKIDLVPGRRQSQYGDDHCLYRSKANSWTQTNITTHINHVTSSNRIIEIKLAKIWRQLHHLEFPSFYLEMAVVDALKYARQGNTAANFLTVLEHFRDHLESSRYMDPANTNNVISDDLSAAKKEQFLSKLGHREINKTGEALFGNMNKAKNKSIADGKAFLCAAFAAEQEVLNVQLKLSSESITHDGVMGDVNERYFIEVLRKYLPNRYAIDSAIVIDSNGHTSDQIDIVVYDPQYTPTLLDQHDHRFIPAEAVYAVFEVKPTINKSYLEYAGHKAESVRVLERTSVPITHVAGDPVIKKIFPIVSGIIATDIEWAEGFDSQAFLENHSALIEDKFLDCGLAVSGGCFDVFEGDIKIGPKSNSLAYFIFRLLQKLNGLGTVPSVDWNKYALVMSDKNV